MTQGVQAIDALVAEHADLERQLSDPELHSNPGNARKVGRRFAQLAPIVATHRKLTSARGDLETARELAVDDASFADEVAELESRVAELDTQLTDMLAPRDPHDADDIVLEVKSGEGGEESALFAADLARMYIRYAERHGWTVTVLDETTSDLGRLQGCDADDRQQGRLGGRRVVAHEIRGRGAPGAAGPGNRIPRPRAYFGGGRAGLSGARRSRLRCRSTSRTCASTSTGPPARAARASTPPTRRCESPTCPPELSSPVKTSDRSCRTRPVRCRCWPLACRQWPRSRRSADASADRASQIRTVDRSERIRTYNFPENRVDRPSHRLQGTQSRSASRR